MLTSGLGQGSMLLRESSGRAMDLHMMLLLDMIMIAHCYRQRSPELPLGAYDLATMVAALRHTPV